MDKKDETPERRQTGGALGFGSSFAAGMAIFSLGGHWLDVKFGTDRVYTLIGIFFGFIYGGWELWKLINISKENEERAEKNRAVEHETGSHESAE